MKENTYGFKKGDTREDLMSDFNKYFRTMYLKIKQEELTNDDDLATVIGLCHQLEEIATTTRDKRLNELYPKEPEHTNGI